MIPELEMYRIGFYVMAVATLAFLVWISRKPAGTRRYYLPAPIICGTLSLAYFGMSIELLRVATPDGQPVPMSRYVDYFIATAVMVLVAGKIADATRRQLAALVTLAVTWVGISLGRYFLPAQQEAVANVLTFVVLGVLLYMLVWPVTKRSGDTSGERVLLYGKLRNLLILLWIAYLIIGIITRQGIGLLDAFSGIFVGAYLDMATRIGFGLLLLRADDAVQRVINDGDAGGAGDEPDAEVTFAESDDADSGTGIDPAD